MRVHPLYKHILVPSGVPLHALPVSSRLLPVHAWLRAGEQRSHICAEKPTELDAAPQLLGWRSSACCGRACATPNLSSRWAAANWRFPSCSASHTHSISDAPACPPMVISWTSNGCAQWVFQAKWVAQVLSGRARLPSRGAMEADIQGFYELLQQASMPVRYTHCQVWPPRCPLAPH